MPMKGSSVGLCLTCNNADGCVYRKRRGTDAVHCETFDNYVPRNGKGAAEAAPVVVMTTADAKAAEFKGICVNCAHRNDCKLSKTETGVWHCEEYE